MCWSAALAVNAPVQAGGSLAVATSAASRIAYCSAPLTVRRGVLLAALRFRVLARKHGTQCIGEAAYLKVVSDGTAK